MEIELIYTLFDNRTGKEIEKHKYVARDPDMPAYLFAPSKGDILKDKYEILKVRSLEFTNRIYIAITVQDFTSKPKLPKPKFFKRLSENQFNLLFTLIFSICLLIVVLIIKFMIWLF